MQTAMLKWIYPLLLVVACMVASTWSQEQSGTRTRNNTCEEQGIIVVQQPQPRIEMCGVDYTWNRLQLLNNTNICAALNKVCDDQYSNTETEDEPIPPVTVTVTECPMVQPTPGSAVGKESSGGSSSTLALGVITGILVVALLVVIVGWVGTCCFVLKKKKGKATEKVSVERPSVHYVPQQKYHDLVQKAPLPQATYYSSLGPDYEVVDKRRSPQSQRVEQSTNVTNNEAAIDHDYHVLELPMVDHTYHVLEIGGGTSRPVAAAPVEKKDGEVPSYEVPMFLQNKSLRMGNET